MSWWMKLDSKGDVEAVYANPQRSIDGVVEVPDDDPRVFEFNRMISARIRREMRE